MRKSWERILRDNFRGIFTQNLVQCDSSDPPRRGDDTVKPLCGLKVAIDMKTAKIKDFTSADGKKHKKRLCYDAEMVPSGAAMEFNIYIEGVKQSSHNLKVEYI